MMKKTLVIVALSAISAFAVADEYDARHAAKQVVDLQDGSTLFVFENGKMAEQSKYGQAVRVAPGTVVKANDGRSITIVGDESGRLDTLLKQGMSS